MNQAGSYHRQHRKRGLAVDVDYRRSVAEPQLEPRFISAAVTRNAVKHFKMPKNTVYSQASVIFFLARHHADGTFKLRNLRETR